MAVYEHTYRPYAGETTPLPSRLSVFPRYAYQEVLKSKLFLAFMVICLLWPFALACILYIPHNLGFLKTFQLDAEDLKILPFFNFDANWFFNWLMLFQSGFAVLVTFVVGPVLVTSDLRNNGLALYFSRPLTRWEYVFGKSLVLVALLSIITWIPGLLLFAFQVYLEGLDWLAQHYRVGIGIFVGFWIWIVVLCLISLSLSAYVKWKPVARLSLILVFFVSGIMAAVVNAMLHTQWGSVINISDMMHVIWASLFGIEPLVSTPLWVAWLSPILFCGFCVVLLARKLRPYEVVR